MIQRTQEWHRARLGHFTASEVGKLLGSNRKGDGFSATAMSLIYKKIGERLLSPEMIQDPERFGEYIYRTEAHSKAMDYGTRTEAEAISYYEALHGCEVEEGGFWLHPEVNMFAASPDGLVGDDGLLEVKCPQVETFARYYTSIKNAKDLREINSDYYWQVQAQLACTGRLWCDWLAYSPDCGNRTVLIRIERDYGDIHTLELAVEKANNLILQLLQDA